VELALKEFHQNSSCRGLFFNLMRKSCQKEGKLPVIMATQTPSVPPAELRTGVKTQMAAARVIRIPTAQVIIKAANWEGDKSELVKKMENSSFTRQIRLVF